jgi:hypothetical protein
LIRYELKKIDIIEDEFKKSPKYDAENYDFDGFLTYETFRIDALKYFKFNTLTTNFKNRRDIPFLRFEVEEFNTIGDEVEIQNIYYGRLSEQDLEDFFSESYFEVEEAEIVKTYFEKYELRKKSIYVHDEEEFFEKLYIVPYTHDSNYEISESYFDYAFERIKKIYEYFDMDNSDKRTFLNRLKCSALASEYVKLDKFW